MQTGPDESTDQTIVTPLMAIAFHCIGAALHFALDAGANVNAVDQNGRTALDYAVAFNKTANGGSGSYACVETIGFLNAAGARSGSVLPSNASGARSRSTALSQDSPPNTTQSLRQRMIGEWNCEATTVEPGTKRAAFITKFNANGTEHVIADRGEGDGKWRLSGNKLNGELHYGGERVSFNGNELILQGAESTFSCSKR